MTINTQKTKNMILFFVNKIEKITSIKLQKAMLFADRLHWMLYKKSISGLEYVKDEYGPVMEKAGWCILSDMDKTDLHLAYEYNGDYTRTIRTTNVQPDMAVFLDIEVESLNKAQDIVSNKTTKQLSEMTHDEAWKKARFGEILSYESCIHDEITGNFIELKDEEEEILQEAIKTANYSELEDLASTWI